MGIQGMELCAVAVVILLFIAVLKQFGILEPISAEDSGDPDVELPTARHPPEGLEQLLARTKFTKTELQSLYRGFKNECPSGLVDEETFTLIYSRFFPRGGGHSGGNGGASAVIHHILLLPPPPPPPGCGRVKITGSIGLQSPGRPGSMGRRRAGVRAGQGGPGSVRAGQGPSRRPPVRAGFRRGALGAAAGHGAAEAQVDVRPLRREQGRLHQQGGHAGDHEVHLCHDGPARRGAQRARSARGALLPEDGQERGRRGDLRGVPGRLPGGQGHHELHADLPQRALDPAPPGAFLLFQTNQRQEKSSMWLPETGQDKDKDKDGAATPD